MAKAIPSPSYLMTSKFANVAIVDASTRSMRSIRTRLSSRFHQRATGSGSSSIASGADKR